MQTILNEPLNDTVLKCEGMRILAEHLGVVESERFIALINREPFDYTKWRQKLFDGVSLETLFKQVQEYEKTTY
ncbi:hypothetical protein FACS1894170_07280 [Planctomycetales bacterium]|nr:hypothetical protein FACS1894170_07280 [Planctomycetales bacterium]